MHLLTNGVDSCLVARLKAQLTCLSPQAWAYGRDLRMAIPFTPFPRSSTPLNSTTPAWSACSRFRSWRLLVVTSLFGVQQIESGTLQYVTEMRIISVSLTSGSGLDVMSLNGPLQARTHGSFWNDDGKVLLRHQRQSQEDGVHGPG